MMPVIQKAFHIALKAVHYRTASLQHLHETLNVQKANLVRASCFGLLFFFGSQNPNAFTQPSQQDTDKEASACLESTCREAPLREHLTAIGFRNKDIGIKYVRGIVGGFAQGSGIAGGVQFTSADTIPYLELRAAALTSTGLDRRFDLEGLFNIGSSRNHADVWFSYMQRENDFFGIGP